jgi:hypothetical protein
MMRMLLKPVERAMMRDNNPNDPASQAIPSG